MKRLKVRFRDWGGRDSIYSPFVARDPEELLGRAQVAGWRNAYIETTVSGSPMSQNSAGGLAVEIQDVDSKTWVMRGRFLYADLLAEFSTERWQRIFATAAGMFVEAEGK
jgi:hypothetical protein